jgi:hypothetical protein
VKLRRHTPLQADWASEAPPHEIGAKLNWSKTKLNMDALYPNRSLLRGIAFKK